MGIQKPKKPAEKKLPPAQRPKKMKPKVSK